MIRLILLTLVVSATITWFFLRGESDDQTAKSAGTSPAEKESVPGPSAEILAKNLREKLKAMTDWKYESVMAVADALDPSARWLLEDEARLERLAKIQMTAKTRELIDEYPASIALLEMTHVDSREALAKGILSPRRAEDQQRLLSSCAKYAEPTALSQWARALEQHWESIALLLEVCPTWPIDTIFLYDQSPAVNETYIAWITDALDSVEEESDFPSMVQFLLEANSIVRAKLNDEEFRSGFLIEDGTWPRFKKCIGLAEKHIETNGGGRMPLWHCYGQEPLLWDLMELYDAEDLFFHAGELAARVLFENPPDDLVKQRLIDLLLMGNSEVYTALDHFGSDSQFQLLLSRGELSNQNLAEGCKRLNDTWDKDSTAAFAKLAEWNAFEEGGDLRLHVSGTDDLKYFKDVPGYGVVNAINKLYSDRQLTWGEDGKNVIKDIVAIYTMGQESTVKEFAIKYSKKAGKALTKGAIDYVGAKTGELADAPRLAVYGILSLEYQGVATLDVDSDVTRMVRLALRFGQDQGQAALGECIRKLDDLGVQLRMKDDSGWVIAAFEDQPGATEFLRVAVWKTGQTAQRMPKNKLLWQQNLAAWWLLANYEN
ncbi:MAG: hypothetical protein ACI8UO_000450 [Verrucomicrobiales bacterium]|jgi:hypothetical protein